MSPLPLLWWKSQQKQLREEPVYFCSQSKGAGARPGQEGRAAGHSASAVRKQRETNTAAQLTRFNSAQNPSPWDAAPHDQMGLPTSVNPVLITSHKHTRGLSPGGSRTCPASEAPAGEISSHGFLCVGERSLSFSSGRMGGVEEQKRVCTDSRADVQAGKERMGHGLPFKSTSSSLKAVGREPWLLLSGIKKENHLPPHSPVSQSLSCKAKKRSSYCTSPAYVCTPR